MRGVSCSTRRPGSPSMCFGAAQSSDRRRHGTASGTGSPGSPSARHQNSICRIDVEPLMEIQPDPQTASRRPRRSGATKRGRGPRRGSVFANDHVTGRLLPSPRTTRGRRSGTHGRSCWPICSTAFAASIARSRPAWRGGAGAVTARHGRGSSAGGRTRRHGPTARPTTSTRRARWRCRPSVHDAARSSRARCCSTSLPPYPTPTMLTRGCATRLRGTRGGGGSAGGGAAWRGSWPRSGGSARG